MSGVSVINPYSLLGDGDDESSQNPQKAASQKAKPKNDNKGRRTGTGDDKKLPQKNRGKDTGARGRGGKRQFERHSGTGRDDRQKRKGAGKFNWGGDGEDKTEIKESQAQAEDEETKDEEPKEEEPPVKTYDEFLKEREAKLVDTNTNIRKAENDESKWTKAAPKTSKVDEEVLWNAPQEKKKGKKNRNKKNIIHFDEFAKSGPTKSAPRSSRGDGERRERRERGDGSNRGRSDGGRGRGRGRGGSGREGGRGGRNLNVGDDRAFPKLGGK